MMSCGCLKVKTKVLSKLNCSYSREQREDSTKEKKTEKNLQQEMNCNSSRDDNIEKNTEDSAQNGLNFAEITAEEKQDCLGKLKTSENKAEIPARRPSTVDRNTEDSQNGLNLAEITAEEKQDGLGKLKTGESKAEIPTVPARRPSTVDRIRSFLKPKRRRDAICDEMERDVDNSGLSLRQYRKFLATTSVLQELKML